VKQTLSTITALHEQWRTLLRTTDTATNAQFSFVVKELRQAIESMDRDLGLLQMGVGEFFRATLNRWNAVECYHERKSQAFN
jgi:hypothetical protein